MYVYLIALAGGIFVYALMRTIIPVSEREIVKGRVSKYFSINSLDEIEDQVRRERQEKANKSKFLRDAEGRLISRSFAEYVSSSGIKLTPSEFLYAWLGLTFIPMLLFAVIGQHIITVIGIGIIGFAVPPFLLQRGRKKRQELFTSQLGEALIVMGNAIKGGFSFRQAMQTIASEMQDPIASEFEKSLREMKYGVTQNDALKHMVERIRNEDLDLLVSAVLTSAQTGGNLSDILETISSTIKDRIRIKQEVKVLTSAGRMSAIIIALLPIFLVLALMFINPEYFGSFVATDIGKVMLAVAIVLEVTGFIVIRKISDVEY